MQESLEAVAHELRGRFEIAIAVDALPAEQLSPDVQADLSRIAREAIANAARHGGATHVVVSLRHMTDGRLRLRVRDDGCGIHSGGQPLRPGFGLRSMCERAETAGGHMTIRQPDDGGTVVDVVLSVSERLRIAGRGSRADARGDSRLLSATRSNSAPRRRRGAGDPSSHA